MIPLLSAPQEYHLYSLHQLDTNWAFIVRFHLRLFCYLTFQLPCGDAFPRVLPSDIVSIEPNCSSNLVASIQVYKPNS